MSAGGELEPDSAALSAAESACVEHGVTRSSIFTGAMRLKKMGHESTYKRRLLWLDPATRSFHWSKDTHKTGASKSVSAQDVLAVEARVRPGKVSVFGPKPSAELCLSLVLHSGEVIDVQLDSVDESREWEKTLRVVLGQPSASGPLKDEASLGGNIGDSDTEQPCIIVPLVIT